jgi:deoxyribodipyrimidine photo-lyase
MFNNVNKKSRVGLERSTFNPTKFATAENAAAVVADPPLPKLLKAVQDAIKNPAKGDSVVYWMRMADLRSMSLYRLNTTQD